MFSRFSTTRNIATYVKAISISNLLHLKPYNQHIKLMGWVKSHRQYKQRSFLHIDDGSTLQRLQVVVPKSVCSNHLTYHTCICIEGKVVETDGRMQNLELVADKIMVISPGAPIEYPFTEKVNYLEEDLRFLPHFRPRTREFPAMLRIRSQARKAIHTFFEKENFLNVDTPILTTNNCEGAGDVFVVKNQIKTNSQGKEKDREGTFDHTVYLTVSGQLHLEAMASGLSRVYNFNPVFRGEKSSRMHLHEFWMVEMEESFLEGRNGYEALIGRLENLMKFTIAEVMEKSLEDLKFLWETNKKSELLQELIPKWIETPFVKMKFKEALEILDANKSQLQKPLPPSTQDLNRESELFLTKYSNNSPVFITDWPASSKPFYMYSEDVNGHDIAFGVDLLAPFVGEIAGGGLREHRYDVLKHKLETEATENLNWYLELRKFGYAPSGGFGFGFERFLQMLLGIDNIKDTVIFPRGNGQCVC